MSLDYIGRNIYGFGIEFVVVLIKQSRRFYTLEGSRKLSGSNC